MQIELYNTMSRKKEPFVPLAANRVGIYVCGVTVWDSTHLGHGRAATVFDVLVRFLHASGYVVTYVRNFTDVDDKIINRAQRENVGWIDIAERFIAEYTRDMTALGNRLPDIEPRASQHIPQMIASIERLIAAGMAYAVNGDVFYAVRKFAAYGRLSGKRIEELEVGARIDANEAKRDPLDFALWKAVKPGEPSWPSPWGDGRPGWHIECSAMSTEYLGQPFDLHGGGRDLIFPHHENEIAQAEGESGQALSRYWLHNGTLDIDSEKMSKSLGNFFKVSDAVAHYDAEVLRYFLLSSHYRSPLDFTTQALADCRQALERFYTLAERLEAEVLASGSGEIAEAQVPTIIPVTVTRVMEALADDLNTPRAFGAVFDGVRELNRVLDGGTLTAEDVAQLRDAWRAARAQWHEILGLFGSEPRAFQERCTTLLLAQRGIARDRIEQLLVERATARQAKDFARSDAIRDELLKQGIEIKDRPGAPTTWMVK